MKKKAQYTLLYVEDEIPLRELVCSFLEEYFSEIYQADNGQIALDILKEKQIDIIMTDIEMPKMNGLDFCEKVRKEDRDTPIIIMTAYSEKEYLLKATELNLIKYLIKPIEEKALFQAIETCFERIEMKSPSIIDLGEGYVFDTFNHQLSQGKKLITLTVSQLLLLEILIKNRGRVVSYEQLEYTIYPHDVISKNALRCLVRDIRIESYKGIIQNISKLGYKVNYHG